MYLLRRLRETAEATPDRLAMVEDGRTLTHDRFWRLICACREDLAPRIRGRGIVVAAVTRRLEGWLLALAVRSLGHDAGVILSAEHLAVFETLDVAAFITLANADPGFAPTGVPHLRLPPPSTLRIDDHAPLPPLPTPEAFGSQILFTSGTTGRYKAYRSDENGSEANLERRRGTYADLGDDFRQFSPDMVLTALDMGLWTAAANTWPRQAWCEGGTVVFQAAGDLAGAFRWPTLTHAVVTPWHLARLAAEPAGAYPYRPDLQLIVVSGAVPHWVARETLRRVSSRMLINLSSTEAGGWARTAVRSEEDLRWYRLDPERRVEVVDDAGVPLPIGELGRVRVAMRPGRTREYLGDPASSKTFFGDGWFYPGDLGVLDGRGRLCLHGRATDVVSIAGEKRVVAPWEAALQEKLACEGVCILAGRAPGEDEKLHVFIESRRPLTRAVLEEAMRTTLTGFTEVTAHKLEALPRTPTGKIRRLDLARQLFGPAPAPAETS